ncbi:hypothetical protein SDC9_115415 [bioreactor metagenome]|uniref:Uncharacterized protein n=1 Tax=bioreactor metagenome TaxID=1076179 RepID=A0A645BTB9_9ZZZZ
MELELKGKFVFNLLILQQKTLQVMLITYQLQNQEPMKPVLKLE